MGASKVTLGFEIAAFCVTLFFAVKISYRALKNKTGPRLVNANGRMRYYSGMFENDVVAILINFITCLAYFGSSMETILHVDGFLHVHRYAPYMISCPLIVYDLIYSSGAPYRVATTILCEVTLLTALLADETEEPMRWAWFAMGSALYVCLAGMLLLVLRRSLKIVDSLIGSKKRHLMDRFNDDGVYGVDGDMMMTPKESLYATRRGGYRHPQYHEHHHSSSHHHVHIQSLQAARRYIILALVCMFFIWPLFPVFFLLEYLNQISRDNATLAYAILDVFAKSSHSFFVEEYKNAMLKKLGEYGHITPDVLRQIDENLDVDLQLQEKAMNLNPASNDQTMSQGVNQKDGRMVGWVWREIWQI